MKLILEIELQENQLPKLKNALEDFCNSNFIPQPVLKQYDVSGSLRDKLEEITAKYWYEVIYSHIDNQDHKKAEESRMEFRSWIDRNLDLFTQ
jgi:hypothetical protein